MHFFRKSVIINKMAYYKSTDKVIDMKKILLLVDDNTVDLTLFKEIFSKEEEYDVVSISSGRKYFPMWKARFPICLLWALVQITLII